MSVAAAVFAALFRALTTLLRAAGARARAMMDAICGPLSEKIESDINVDYSAGFKGGARVVTAAPSLALASQPPDKVHRLRVQRPTTPRRSSSEILSICFNNFGKLLQPF